MRCLSVCQQAKSKSCRRRSCCFMKFLEGRGVWLARTDKILVMLRQGCGLGYTAALEEVCTLRMLYPRAGSGVVRMDPLRFLAGCRTRRLNQA